MSALAPVPGRPRQWLALLALASLDGGSVHADMIDKAGMSDWEVCGLCHGANGISAMPKFPKLAGQKAEYLEREFKRFRRGDRTNDGGQMQAITTEVAMSAVVGIATYFSELPPPEVDASAIELAHANPDVFARGRRLFLEGEGELAACADCHADRHSDAPWIDGQHRDYVRKQLEDFRSGRRPDGAGDMAEIAARLNEQDVSAVALFVSATRLIRE